MTTLYRHFNAKGELLYVGIADKWEKRTAGHASSKWFKDIASVTVQNFKTRAKAIEAERVAVQVEFPIHNKALRTIPASRSSLRQPPRHITINLEKNPDVAALINDAKEIMPWVPVATLVMIALRRELRCARYRRANYAARLARKPQP